MINAKRMVDLIGSAVGLLLTWPVFVMIAVAIKAEDGGPVFFRQQRVGLRGRLFQTWKFRTMRNSSNGGLALTVAGDERVTRVGRWIRRFKVDELPQLCQVLWGEMSLVGPRPEVPGYVAHYTDDLLPVLDYLPGITDPASVEGWDEGEVLRRASDPEQAYLSEVMPAKVRRQLAYAKRATVRSDLLVLLATVGHPWDAISPFVVAKMVEYRRLIIVTVHVLLISLSYRAAYELRFEFQVPADLERVFWSTLPVLLAIRLATYSRFGLYRGYWKHFSVEDLFQLTMAVTASSGIYLTALAAAGQLGRVPRSILLLDWLGVIFLVGGTHLVARSLQEGRLRLMPRPGRRSLVVGAGDSAERLLREALRNGHGALQVDGLVVEDAGSRGRSIHRVPVVGTITNLPELVALFEADLVVIALDNPSGALMQHVVERCVASGVEYRTLPSLEELLAGTAPLDQLRPVELKDLLGRDQVELDVTPIRADLAGKHVLVTGGAGSIGSELARQIAGFGPARLILVDQAESALFFTHLDLVRTHPSVDIVPLVGDVTDARLLSQIFSVHRPEYVVHAAAYKHVPLMENNPGEAVRNNIVGTLITARVAATFGVGKFILISTDKAVKPASVMGATKRVAERLVLGLPSLQRSLTDFRVVRFGNVLGSAGSVVPVFERQLANGGPITVTHPDATRYFMTITEAVSLVLQAAALPGARGRICMLDMGRPVRIVDLARKMIALAGPKRLRDPRIVYTGLRPGEKLAEDLVSTSETSLPTAVSKIRIVASPEEKGEVVEQMLATLLRAHGASDANLLLQELATVVPDYHCSTAAVPPIKPKQHEMDRALAVPTASA